MFLSILFVSQFINLDSVDEGPAIVVSLDKIVIDWQSVVIQNLKSRSIR